MTAPFGMTASFSMTASFRMTAAIEQLYYNRHIMKIPGHHSYYIYIVTNKNKTVLYTGVTNDLRRRLWEHEQNSIPFRSPSFAGKYNAYFLIYYECFGFIQNAIAREKEIKGWRRSKKEDLIKTMNPECVF